MSGDWLIQRQGDTMRIESSALPDELVREVRLVLLKLMEESGDTEVTEDDLSYANIVVGEIGTTLTKAEKIRRSTERLRWLMLSAAICNVAVAIWNLGVIFGGTR